MLNHGRFEEIKLVGCGKSITNLLIISDILD
jgi:hypothetical protein